VTGTGHPAESPVMTRSFAIALASFAATALVILSRGGVTFG